MIDGGETTLNSSELSVTVLKYSGTVARLSPKADRTIDYTPGDRLKERSADTFYHLGDLDLRIRAAGAQDWTDVSTAFHRAPVNVVAAEAGRFSGDVTSSLPDGQSKAVISSCDLPSRTMAPRPWNWAASAYRWCSTTS
jgi:hypothetical protein